MTNKRWKHQRKDKRNEKKKQWAGTGFQHIWHTVWTPLCPSPYLSVAPQLVSLHAVTVVQGDWAVVRDGIKADLPCVHGVTHPDILPPAECQHLQRTTCKLWPTLGRIPPSLTPLFNHFFPFCGVFFFPKVGVSYIVEVLKPMGSNGIIKGQTF